MRGKMQEIGLGHTEEIAGYLGHEMVGIHTHLAEGTEAHRATHVLGRRDHLEVAGPIIENVSVEVVDLHTGLAGTYPCFIDEKVAMFVAEMAHLRIDTTPLAIMTS